MIFAPRRADDLNADRQRMTGKPHRHRADRQADARDRLRQDAHARPGSEALAVDVDPLGADRCCRNRCCRREQDVDAGHQIGHAFREPVPHALGLYDPRRRQQRAGEKAVSRQRLEVGSASPQIGQVQGAPFCIRDDECRRARVLDMRQLDAARDAERGCNAIHRSARLGARVIVEISAERRDAQPVEACLELRFSGLRGPRGAGRIARIRSLHRVVRESEIACRPRKRPEMIEAGDERVRSDSRQPAERRLQSEDAAQRSRHADRPVRVGAERDRHLSGGNRGGRSAGRSARDARHVVRVARRAVVRVLGGEAVRVLVHVQRADENRARGLHPLDENRVLTGRLALALDLRAGARGQARDVEQVLRGERNAGERQVARSAAATRELRVDARRLVQRALGNDIGECIDDSIGRVDPGQRGAHDVRRGAFAGTDRCRDLRSGLARSFAGHCGRSPRAGAIGRNVGAGSSSIPSG